jgi:hypothetical protein
MANSNQRQALAVSSRLSSQVLPGYTAGDIASLESNAAKIMSNHESRVSNGQGTSGKAVRLRPRQKHYGPLRGRVRRRHYSRLITSGGSNSQLLPSLLQ